MTQRTIDEIRIDCVSRGGFITESDLIEITSADRLAPLLIRHSHGRMTVPAQDVEHAIRLIEAYPDSHLRDVSFPAKTYDRLPLYM